MIAELDNSISALLLESLGKLHTKEYSFQSPLKNQERC